MFYNEKYTYMFRAATLVVTDDPVPRDMFYDGHPKNERGAVVLRVAPTWFRWVICIYINDRYT